MKGITIAFDTGLTEKETDTILEIVDAATFRVFLGDAIGAGVFHPGDDRKSVSARLLDYYRPPRPAWGDIAHQIECLDVLSAEYMLAQRLLHVLANGEDVAQEVAEYNQVLKKCCPPAIFHETFRNAVSHRFTHQGMMALSGLIFCLAHELTCEVHTTLAERAVSARIHFGRRSIDNDGLTDALKDEAQRMVIANHMAQATGAVNYDNDLIDTLAGQAETYCRSFIEIFKDPVYGDPVEYGPAMEGFNRAIDNVSPGDGMGRFLGLACQGLLIRNLTGQGDLDRWEKILLSSRDICDFRMARRLMKKLKDAADDEE